MKNLLNELRRRNVFRVAAAYLVVGWMVMQIVSVMTPALQLPVWVNGFFAVLLMVGLPIALLLAWAFEMTPAGVKKTEAVKGEIEMRPLGATDFVLIGLMVVVVGMVGYQIANGGDDAPVVQTADAGEASPAIAEASETTAAEVAPAAPTAPALSVAVLPFVAMSSNEDDGYFADGLTEEILNSLAALPQLLVTSRTSAFQFKGDNIPSVPEIARQLGVAHIVEGSVRRAGNQVRITVQVIRAGDDSHLWSQTYDRPMDDVFAVQEDIAENIAGVLDIVLDEEQRQLMRATGVDNVEAFIAYQRGVEIYHSGHSGDDPFIVSLEPADAFFAEATRLVPDFSEAYLLQSDYYSHLIYHHATAETEEEREGLDEARARYFELLDLASASALDPARRALITIDRIFASDNWIGANQVLDEILNVTGCPVDNWVADMVLYSGRAAEFAPYFRRQAQCDPLVTSSWRNLARVYLAAGEFTLALEAVDRGLIVSPEQYSLHNMRKIILLSERRYEDLLAYVDLRQDDRDFYALQIALREGDQEMATAHLASMGYQIRDGNPDLETIDASDWSIDVVVLYAQIGDRELANAMAALNDNPAVAADELQYAIMACQCGAPWDIEVTPNFAARLAEAEFPWPPPGTGDYPLKDW